MLADPAMLQIAQGGEIIVGTKKIDPGELFSEIMSSLTENDKIVKDMSPEEIEQMEQQRMEQQRMMAEQEAAMMQQEQPMEQGMEQPLDESQIDPALLEQLNNVEAIMAEYGVDESTAEAMLEAERQGFSPEEIQEGLMRNSPQPQEAM